MLSFLRPTLFMTLFIAATSLQAHHSQAQEVSTLHLSQFNWSSDFFAPMQGGVILSAKKLDHLTQHQHDFEGWAKARSKQSKGVSRFWSGFCDAIATLQLSFPTLHLSAKKINTPTGMVEVTPRDWVAFAAIAIAQNKFIGTETEFIGQRCNRSRALHTPAHTQACNQDIDVLKFFELIMQDLPKGRAFIVDFNRHAWVDNGVVVGMQLQTKSLTPKERVYVATLQTLKIQYPKIRDLNQPRTKTHTFQFQIQTDDSGKPISGRWLQPPPVDFIWRQYLFQFRDEFQFLNSTFNSSR